MITRRALLDIQEKVLSEQGTIRYRDFEALLAGLGFEQKGQKGIHRIYIHPLAGRAFPIQPERNEAKRYQVRQLRDMILIYRLKLGDRG